MSDRRSFVAQFTAALALFRIPRRDLDPPPAPSLEREVDARWTAIEHAPGIGERCEFSYDGEHWHPIALLSDAGRYALDSAGAPYLRRSERYNPITREVYITVALVRSGDVVAWVDTRVYDRFLDVGRSEATRVLVDRLGWATR